MEIWHSERGAIRKGKNMIMSWNAPWPLAKIEIHREKIVIKYFFKKLEIMKHEITAIEEYNIMPIIGQGIKIKHNTNKSPLIMFYTRNIKKLEEKLKEAGYNELYKKPNN